MTPTLLLQSGHSTESGARTPSEEGVLEMKAVFLSSILFILPISVFAGSVTYDLPYAYASPSKMSVCVGEKSSRDYARAMYDLIENGGYKTIEALLVLKSRAINNGGSEFDCYILNVEIWLKTRSNNPVIDIIEVFNLRDWVRVRPLYFVKATVKNMDNGDVYSLDTVGQEIYVAFTDDYVIKNRPE